MILLKITGKLASTPPTYDLLARDYFSLTVLLTARLQCSQFLMTGTWYPGTLEDSL